MPRVATAVTVITERHFDFTRAEVEIMLRREILGTDIQAGVVFEWDGDPEGLAGGDRLVRAINTVTEHK